MSQTTNTAELSISESNRKELGYSTASTTTSSNFIPATNKYTHNTPDSQEPMEDPNVSPEINARRRKELEAVRNLNMAVQTINSNFEKNKSNLQQFKQTVNQTNQLLDMWIKILSQTEHTKRLMEDPEWEGGALDATLAERDLQESRREKNDATQNQAQEQRRSLGEEKVKGLSRQMSRNRKVEVQKLSEAKQMPVSKARQSRNTKPATK
ncbi:hypothetical protein INT43_008500 [Umbelopsis isabellina]|uniref:DASH complex subunit DUO1 n=1 Tax=Mortierella isabellina TaxID=91625 RepID=A0A8H7UFC0_MORIS|nr:hypothetical protein INT43_008500 [Umbelopsis isabellina]